MTDLGFSWRATKSGEVRIFREGRIVSTLRGSAAERFLRRADSAGEAAQQQLMARATGNYRRGNERRG
jgi:hypothetical protein